MVRYDLIPTREVAEEARKKGMRADEYLRQQTVRHLGGSDGRLKDKYGTKYLQDILITRSDGSRMVIHEEISDVDELQLLKLSEVNERNEIVSNITAYTHGIDFARMQTEPEYLNVIGDELLSRNRLYAKLLESQSRGITDFIYVGTIGIGSETGRYEKLAYSYDSIVNKVNSVRQMRMQEMKKGEDEQQRRKMIEEIQKKLNTLSIEQVQQICQVLGIDLDNDRQF